MAGRAAGSNPAWGKDILFVFLQSTEMSLTLVLFKLYIFACIGTEIHVNMRVILGVTLLCG